MLRVNRVPNYYRIMMAAVSVDAVRVLSVDNINPNVKNMEYAVRGPLLIRADEIEKELANVSIPFIF